MAKIDIKYSSGQLASTSGRPGVEPIDLSGAMNAAEVVAEDSLRKYKERVQLEEYARDTNYSADALVKMNSEVQRIKEENKQLLYDNPDAYSSTILSQAQPILQGFVDAAPSVKAKAALQQQTAQMRVHLGLNTANDASEARIAMYDSKFAENMDLISAKVFNDPKTLEEAKIERLALLEGYKTIVSPDKFAKVEAETSERLDRTFLQGAASKHPEDTLKAIKSGNFNHLGAEDLAKVEHAAYQEIETRLVEQEKAREEQRQAIVLDVKSRLAQSRDLRSADKMVDEVLNKKEALGKNFPAVLNEAYSNYDHWKSKQEEVVRVATFIDSGVHLEPGNAKDEKAADIAFDQFRDQYNKAEPQEKVNILASWLDRVGVLPPSVEKGLFDSLRHGTPEAKVMAAITLDNLIDQDERIIRQFSGRTQDVALAAKIALNRSYGMSAAEAVTSAEKDVVEGAASQTTQDPRRKAKITLYNQEREPITLSDFTELFRDDPDVINPEMLAEAEDYKRQLAVNFGIPHEEAHKRAVAKTKAMWGVTEINGVKEFTRNPAEKVFGGKGDNSWIKEQLHKEVTSVGRTLSGKKVTAEGLIVKPVPEFLNKGKLPTYMVLHDDGLGIPQPVLKEDKNKNLVPFVWQPSISTSEKSTKPKMITQEKLNTLNSEANLSAKYRVRHKILTEALKSEDVTPELKKRIRRDMLPLVPKEGAAPEQLNLEDIKPVGLKPRTGKNLNIGDK